MLAKERRRRYPAQTIMDMDFTDNIVFLANTPTQAKSLLHSLEQAGDIGLNTNADKTEYTCSNPRGNISTLKWWSSENSGQVHLPQNQPLNN